MTGKLGPTAQQQMAELQKLLPIASRLNSLVEQYASARSGHENWKGMIKRAGAQAKIAFVTAGYDQLAQLCGSIELAVSRGGNPNTVARTLRELVGSLRFQLELAARTIVREDTEAQLAKKKQAE